MEKICGWWSRELQDYLLSHPFSPMQLYYSKRAGQILATILVLELPCLLQRVVISSAKKPSHLPLACRYLRHDHIGGSNKFINLVSIEYPSPLLILLKRWAALICEHRPGVDPNKWHVSLVAEDIALVLCNRLQAPGDIWTIHKWLLRVIVLYNDQNSSGYVSIRRVRIFNHLIVARPMRTTWQIYGANHYRSHNIDITGILIVPLSDLNCKTENVQ